MSRGYELHNSFSSKTPICQALCHPALTQLYNDNKSLQSVNLSHRWFHLSSEWPYEVGIPTDL